MVYPPGRFSRAGSIVGTTLRTYRGGWLTAITASLGGGNVDTALCNYHHLNLVNASTNVSRNSSGMIANGLRLSSLPR